MSSVVESQSVPSPRHHSSNRTSLTGEARDLVEEYLPLAQKIARHNGGRLEADDAFQIAALALCDAAHRFDAHRGVSLGQFARRRILGALKDAWRREVPASDRWTPTVSFDEAIHGRGGSLESESSITRHEELIADLPEGLRTVATQCLVQGRRQADVAREQGVSQQAISSLVCRSRRLLARCAANAVELDSTAA